MGRHDESVTAVEVTDPLVGTIFDKRFRVDQRLAAGGFGAIYSATHVKSGHPFALKVLHPNLASDLGVLARFRREGTTLTSLRNQHTINAYEFGQSDKTLFIVLELLSGETLFDRYSMNGPMEWKRVVHISKQVCESLEEAHAQGIVHRDLKPTNIHLEEVDGDPDYVKVLDFGIAKILRGSTEHESQDITNAGQMIGTLDYMSPEQMVGGQVTGQTDVYTLGIVMYEMIAGTRPFPESETATAALAAMLKLTPEPLYLRAPIPKELDAIVMRCLAKETQKRYRSVIELRNDLEKLVASPPKPAQTKPFPRDEHDDETAITPPPERVLDALKTPRAERASSDVATPSVERKTPRVDVQTPGLDVKTPRVEAKTPRVDVNKTPPPEWDDDDDERAPTTTRHPDGRDDTPTPVPRAKSAPSIPPTPPVRPLESRHVATPVPQLVVAPFSQTARDPRMRPPTTPPPLGPGFPPRGIESPARGATTVGAPPAPTPGPFQPVLPTPGTGFAPQLPMTPTPGTGFAPQQLPMTPTPGAYGYAPSQRPQTAGFDMSKLAARDAAMRRLVWIIVLVVAAGVGFVVATQL